MCALKYLVFAMLPIALGSPTNNTRSSLTFRRSFTDPIDTRDDRFQWGSVGDSWASGVSFDGTKTDYDGDLHGCHRWKDSYGPIMERDTTWTTGTQKFGFGACSGATLVNIVKAKQGDNPIQMELVGNPQMITYHAGGNNCQFGAVVGDCIYQHENFGNGYGPEYPDPAGKCAQRISDRLIYMNDPKGLYKDELATVVDLVGHPAVKNNKDFRLYILGYAHFFNLGANYCDDLTFSPWQSFNKGPKLSNRLRTDLNGAVETMNQILRRVATDVNDSRVKYLDISFAFDSHRFCEDSHKGNTNDQWYSTDVWLWNLNLPANDPPANPALMDAWIHKGVIDNSTGATLPAFPASVVIGQEFQGDGPETDSLGGGWQARPFHPKIGGAQAIADIVMAQAKADKIPGVVGSSPPTTGTCDCDESGCSPTSPACCANGTC